MNMSISHQKRFKKFVNNQKIKMNERHRFQIFKVKNHVLLNEFATHWILPDDITNSELHRLCKIRIRATQQTDALIAEEFLMYFLGEIFTLNPQLQELAEFIIQPRHDFPNISAVILDIIGGVSSNLNFEDIQYFLAYPMFLRPKAYEKLEDLARSFYYQDHQHPIAETETETEGLDFLLSKTTAEKIINAQSKIKSHV